MPELTEPTVAAEATTEAPRRRRRARPPSDSTGADASTAIAEPAALSDPLPFAGEVTATSDEFRLRGRTDPPPAAHRDWDLPAAPAVWSQPAGLIAGHDSEERNRPLEVPDSPSLGPEGKRRSPWAVVALSVLTLGFYSLVWHHNVNVEVGDFDTRMYVKAGRSTLAVWIAWLAGLLISAAGAVLIVSNQMHVNLPYHPPLSTLEQYLLLGGIVVVPYLVLALPFAVISLVMTVERVRIVEDRVGRPTDVQLRPVSMVWLLAVPIAGGLIFQALIQRRLNLVWDQVAPAPAARISEY